MIIYILKINKYFNSDLEVDFLHILPYQELPV